MCGRGWTYLLDAMPLAGVIRKVLTGSGECAKVDWTSWACRCRSGACSGSCCWRVGVVAAFAPR